MTVMVVDTLQAVDIPHAQAAQSTQGLKVRLERVAVAQSRQRIAMFFNSICTRCIGRLAQRLSTNCPEAQATNVSRTPSFLLVLLEIGLTWAVNQSEICPSQRYISRVCITLLE